MISFFGYVYVRKFEFLDIFGRKHDRKIKLLVVELSDVQTIHQSTFGSKIDKQRLSKANQRLWSMKFRQ